MHRGPALALALALIGGPILCGAVYFLAEAPSQAPGVYVGILTGVHRLSTCVPGASSPADVSTTAVVVPAEVGAFFIVLPDEVPAPANAESAKLYLRVVNHAEPKTDYGREPLTTAVRRLTSRVYRVSSDQTLRWDSNGLTSVVYRKALSRMLGNRATTEVLVELEVPDAAGSCRYAVTLGPPPSLPDSTVKWFVPPAEKRP